MNMGGVWWHGWVDGKGEGKKKGKDRGIVHNFSFVLGLTNEEYANVDIAIVEKRNLSFPNFSADRIYKPPPNPTQPNPTPSLLQNLHINNLNILLRLLLIQPRILNPMHHIQPLHRAAKDRMFLIQPGRLLRRDEELGAVGVGARVGHADGIRLVVLERREFVGEFGAPDAFAAGAVAEGIAALGGVGVSWGGLILWGEGGFTWIMNLRITRWKMVLL